MEWGFTLILFMLAVLAYRQRKIEEEHSRLYDELRKNHEDTQDELVSPKEIETKVEEPVEK